MSIRPLKSFCTPKRARPLKHDLTGKHFGRLFIVSFSHTNGKATYWVAACSCGSLSCPTTHGLLQTGVVSCGCYRRERNLEVNATHGSSDTRLYRIWAGMCARCENPNNMRFKDYGARGISVCQEWRDDFAKF